MSFFFVLPHYELCPLGAETILLNPDSHFCSGGDPLPPPLQLAIRPDKPSEARGDRGVGGLQGPAGLQHGAGHGGGRPQQRHRLQVTNADWL